MVAYTNNAIDMVARKIKYTSLTETWSLVLGIEFSFISFRRKDKNYFAFSTNVTMSYDSKPTSTDSAGCNFLLSHVDAYNNKKTRSNRKHRDTQIQHYLIPNFATLLRSISDRKNALNSLFTRFPLNIKLSEIFVKNGASRPSPDILLVV